MHPLDNPTWTALTTLQAKLAVSSGDAKRFPPEVTVLGALREFSAEAFASLATLATEHPVTIYSATESPLPPGWTIVRHVELAQMVHEGELPPDGQAKSTGADLIELTEADVPEMSVVYTATRPGRTLCPLIQRLGGFLGIRKDGALVAIGGVRLHLNGYREITTVGTLPGHTGRGYATALVSALVQRIRNDGERPFLTVGIANIRAREIYRRLGFRERTQIHSRTIRYAQQKTG
jgi:ribosomal protein S18 acetylase RimI-like enzyme